MSFFPTNKKGERTIKVKHIVEVYEDPIEETKQEYNTNYGKWLKSVRVDDCNETLESVAAAIGIDVETLQKIENGTEIHMYDALKLCEYYEIDE